MLKLTAIPGFKGIKLFIPAVLSLLQLGVFAQRPLAPLQKNEWHIQELTHAIYDYESTHSFRESIVYVPDGAITAVQIDKDEWGAVKVNKKGATAWQYLSIPGPIIGIAKHGGQVLIFYTDGEVFTKTIHAVSLNIDNGKKLQEKVVYEQAEAGFIDTRTLTRNDGSFISLMVRASLSHKRKTKPGKDQEEKLSVEKLVYVNLDASLAAKQVPIKAHGAQGLFINAIAGKNDDLFYCSLVDEQILMERISPAGAVIDKLSILSPLRNGNQITNPRISIDTYDPQTVLIGMRYDNKEKDRVIQVTAFNFTTKKVLTSGEERPKELKNVLEPAEIKELKGVGLSELSALRVVDMVYTKDRIAVIKEIQYYTSGDNNRVWYSTESMVVSIYDRQMKFLKHISLEKKFEINIEAGLSSGYHVKDDNLILVMTGSKGALSFATLYASINLQTQKLEKYEILDKMDIAKMLVIEGDATLWFDDGFFLQYIISKGGAFKVKDFHSRLQKVTY